MSKAKPIAWTIFSRSFGIIIFLIMLFLVNVLAAFIDIEVFTQIVEVLNGNIALIVIIAILFLIGGVFDLLEYPANLPTPLFNAAGAVLSIYFVFIVLEFIDSLVNLNFSNFFDAISHFIYPLIFAIVLIVGYASIFSKEAGKNLRTKKPKRKKK